MPGPSPRTSKKRAERSLYFRRIGQAQGEWQSYHVGRADQLLDECPPEMRDWEWSYLKSLCHADLRTLRGHSDNVWSLAYSPDGQTIASGSGQWGWARPGEIILWDAATGQRRAVLRGHSGPIMGLAFSPDGQMIASASIGWEGAGPGGVKIWSRAGKELLALSSPGDNAFAVKFSPDGRQLVTAGFDGPVRLWNVANGELQGTFVGHKGNVFDVAFSPDGQRLASVGHDGSARVWDRVSGAQLQALTGYDDLRRVAYSPDGRFLAFSNFGNDLRIWDLAKPPDTLERYSYDVDVILSFAYSPEGRRIGLSGRDGSVLIVEAASERILKQLHTHNGVVRDLVFSPDGRVLATAGMDRLVKTWDARTDWNAELIQLNRFANCGSFHRIAFAPDGGRLLLPNGFNRGWHGAGEKTLLVWDFEQWKVVQTLRGHTDWLTGVAVSRDGSRYATASEDKTARLWNAATGAEERKLVGHAAGLTCIAFDLSGARVATASGDGTARIWNAATGQQQRELKGHAGKVTSVAFRPDGRRLASAGHDKLIRIWDPDSGAELLVLRGHTAAVTALAYSHDGQWIASAGEDETVRLWNAASGAPLHVLRGHSGTVLDVAFSLDDRRIGSAGADWTAKLWDPVSGEEALTLLAPKAVLCLGFHPDGKRLVSVDDWMIRLWDSEPQPLSPRLAAAFDGANLAWHVREAEKCIAEKHFSAAMFHFRRLLALRPDRDQHYSHRGDALANAGDLEGAATVFAAVFERAAIFPFQIHDHLLLQLYFGHLDEYRRACQRLLDLINDKSQPAQLYLAVWHSALDSSAVDDPAKLLALAERAAAAATPPEQRDVLQSWGIALFRCGRYEEARQKLEQALTLKGGGAVENWLLLAMIEARLGHVDQARQWLDESTQWLAAQPAMKFDGSPLGASWSSHVCRAILAREAKSLVAGLAPPTP